jgi:hypothetical protein
MSTTLVLLLAVLACQRGVQAGDPEIYSTYRVVAEFPHDTGAFTQGVCAPGDALGVCLHGTHASCMPGPGGMHARHLICTRAHTRAGLVYDRLCEGGDVCRDVFWESTGACVCAAHTRMHARTHTHTRTRTHHHHR